MYKSALQKLFVLLLMITLPVFIMKRHKLFRDRTAYIASEKVSQDRVINDKHFVVTIPLNTVNIKLEKTLNKLMEQDYDNIEVIFIDSSNSNRVYSELKTLYSRLKRDHPHCQIPYSIQTSYYDTMHTLNDNDIVVHVEPGDWLAKESTLSKLATIFSNSEVWLVYSPYIAFPSYEHKLEHPRKEEKWWKLHTRKSEWLESPLKVFYAGLFKQIKFELAQPKNLQPLVQLNVFLMPMVDNARKHIMYIKEILYYHDDTTHPYHDVMVYQPTF